MGVDAAPFLADSALENLRRHNWPGNVRELRNVIERAAVLAEPLLPAAAITAPPTGVDLAVPFRVGKRRLVDDYEHQYVTAMLAACNGNVSEAARRAGIERISMYRTLQRLGLKK
jgi:DNA-binding NtrC family response regulator